jgi:capsular polysaccharide biosynthesis protein
MELREYWRVFKRRAWIPILLLIVTVATAGTLAVLSKPEYQATATVSAKSVGTTTSGQTLSFPEVATSNTLLAQVIQKLSLNESVDHLNSRTKIATGKSNAFTITVTDPNPDSATNIANTIADLSAVRYQTVNSDTSTSVYDDAVQTARAQFQKQYQDAVLARVSYERDHPNAANSKDPTVVVQDSLLRAEEQAAATSLTSFETGTTTDAVNQLSTANNFVAKVVDQAAAKPDLSSRYLKVGYAAALALILGIGLIYLLEYMDNSVREPEAAEEMVGAPVVGIIPRATAQTLRPARGGAR